MSSDEGRPCAACKHLRRKCGHDCVFAPFFPPEHRSLFETVHSTYGASNVSKLLQDLPPERRAEAVQSLVHDATRRQHDPVYGTPGYIFVLHHQLKRVDDQLRKAREELQFFLAHTPPVSQQLAPYGNPASNFHNLPQQQHQDFPGPASAAPSQMLAQLLQRFGVQETGTGPSAPSTQGFTEQYATMSSQHSGSGAEGKSGVNLRFDPQFYFDTARQAQEMGPGTSAPSTRGFTEQYATTSLQHGGSAAEGTSGVNLGFDQQTYFDNAVQVQHPLQHRTDGKGPDPSDAAKQQLAMIEHELMRNLKQDSMGFRATGGDGGGASGMNLLLSGDDIFQSLPDLIPNFDPNAFQFQRPQQQPQEQAGPTGTAAAPHRIFE